MELRINSKIQSDGRVEYKLTHLHDTIGRTMASEFLFANACNHTAG